MTKATGVFPARPPECVVPSTSPTQHLLLQERLVRLFRHKSAQDLEGTMALFSQRPCTYIDVTLDWDLGSWTKLHDSLAQYMSGWPNSASCLVRIVGDLRSAVVFFTDTPGLFGSSEITLAGAVDFEEGRTPS
ncbi:hypothetical protein ACFVW9_39345 [Streptomyces sp. NPDC058217]|uniref:hypothetical protein n=1 Tax=Streptomyces sp. NPDC058217 TaxID=3346384 RepID=UPI0036E025E6